MPNKVLDVLNEARETYLNDSSAETYTNDILLPKLRTAYNLMETSLIEYKIQTKNEEAIKTITAGETEYTPLPNDLFIPVKMEEREPGSTDEWRFMHLERNLQQVKEQPFLVFWTWRLDRIFMAEAQNNREVRLTYQKIFPALNTPNQEVFGKAFQYLSAKAAALVYMFVEQAPTLAQEANNIANAELDQIINIQTKIMQAIPVRRRPYIPGRAR